MQFEKFRLVFSSCVPNISGVPKFSSFRLLPYLCYNFGWLQNRKISFGASTVLRASSERDCGGYVELLTHDLVQLSECFSPRTTMLVREHKS